MAFPIIPGGMWSGQGSTVKPNVGANGTISSSITSSKITNLSNAFDSDPNTYADIQNAGLNSSGPSGTQEVLFTHSPASGLTAGSFLNLVASVRANAYFTNRVISWPDTSLLLTVNGNYSDTTPIQSSGNPYTIISASGSVIDAAILKNGSYSLAFTGNIQISFDQFSPLTIDIYSLSLSLKWQFSGSSSSNTVGSLFDCRVYDISYIYL